MDSDENERVPRIELQVREYIATFLGLALVFALTVGFKVSLDSSPDGPVVNMAKAPWVFGAIQLLLQYWPLWLSGWLFPLVSAAVLFSLPWWAGKLKIKWFRVVFLLFSLVWVGLTGAYFFVG